MNIYGSTISLLERGLNFSSAKGKVIAQNIANVDTPNYKAKSVSFKELLHESSSSSLRAYRTNELHLDFTSNVSTNGIKSLDFRYRHNGNGVDMEKEQADLAANQIYYNALVDRLNGKFNTLQNVIKGGR
ncbi:flagellar basal body rod protein FlgB [Sporosarcina highlanderae]|uniref:Flagellar basal body rod protein FlgB n=1 Tax=Sporosarcina highlanderae TaxID=3035916 RepID=A0ABT8JQV5_9BACL|nr:flagellar basal body rod protein FlgB [Sporosarcina highlanderae]MDN4607470.1 flagellar basal body rod protein FlgB [Sporosarcina highlanderae]